MMLLGISFLNGGDYECSTAMMDSSKAYSNFTRSLNTQNLELAQYYLDTYKSLIFKIEIECKYVMDEATYNELTKKNNLTARQLEEVLLMDIQDKIRALEVDRILRKNHPDWYK